MEGDERQRRQYGHSAFGVPDLRGAPGGSIADALDPRAGSGGNVAERLGQSQMIAARNSTTVSITPNGDTPQDLGNYGYPQGQQYAAPPIQGSGVQFNADYAQVTQRQQQYPNYTSQVMYNVSPQTQQTSPYDSVPHMQSRQPAALDVLPTQLVVPQYYNAGETTSAPVAASISQQYTPAQFQQPLQYQPQASLTQSTLPSAYASGIADFAQPSSPEMIEPQDENTNIMEQAHGQYLRAVKEAFENTHAGRLVEAGRSLLEISVWLIGHAGDLGLLIENHELRDGRIQLWDQFNTCWLALLQRQKDHTQVMLDTGRPPTPPQNLLEDTFLEEIGNEIVRLCDTIERHGLVDYQMGVWEEEIISVLSQCLDLLEGDGEGAPEDRAQVEATSSTSSNLPSTQVCLR